MAYEQRDNSGSLFKNTDKQEPAHADYTGSIKVAGVEYWLNAWIKQSKGGKMFMSLSAKPKQARAGAAPKAAVAGPDDDLPF